MKGKLIKKENNWYVRTTTSEESDDVSIVDYPVFNSFSPKENLEVDFQVEIAIKDTARTDYAIINPKVNRVEIISKNKGRLHYYGGDVELSFQDLGKTLKIFVK